MSYFTCSCDALLGLMIKCESFAMSDIPSSIGPPASFRASSISVSVELEMKINLVKIQKGPSNRNRKRCKDFKKTSYLVKFPLTGSDIDLSISLLDLDVLAEAEEDPEANAWSTQAIKFLRSALATSAFKTSSSPI